MFVTAIIAAGGRGLRFGGGSPKQFLEVGGRAILERIWLAERLDLSEADIAYWKAKLLTIPHRRTSARTAGHVDA